MTLAEPRTELFEAARRPFEDARSMPPNVYTSEEFLAREIATIFSREWICVGRANTLANPGDYLTYELAGQPAVVLRDRDSKLRAFSNVCLIGCRSCSKDRATDAPSSVRTTPGPTVSTVGSSARHS